MIGASQVLAYNLVFASAWSLLTVFLLRFSGRSHEYVSRVVSLVHSIVSIAACSLALYSYYPEGDFCSPIKDLEMIAISLSNAYFFVDAVGMLFSPFYDTVFMLHHVASAVCFLLPLVTGHSGYDVVLVILLLECSNPPMHLHWLLMDHNMTSGIEEPPSKFLVLVRRLFYVTFFVGRIIIGPVIWYKAFVLHGCTYRLHAIIGFAFTGVSYQFFVNLMSKVIRKEPWR